MKKEQILKKAIEKAEKNGYTVGENHLETWEVQCPAVHVYSNGVKIKSTLLKEIIFSHDFAKAFWGIKWGDGCCRYCQIPPGLTHPYPCPYRNAVPEPLVWQYHLQQMVLEEEPLLYLKQFLND